MKLTIEIPEKTYQKIIAGMYDYGDMNVIIQNGTKYEEKPHGEWINFTLEGGFFSSHKCSNCGFNGNQLWHFCPSCGALMRVKYELNRVSKELNSEIEKLKSEIENSDLPERFTATDCSCLNCKNRHSVHCEPQYKKIYGYCGNWERR